MGNFYFDESKHEIGNFIIGAYVYSEKDIADDVDRALLSVGLKPKVDEYKSSSCKNDNVRHALRSSLFEILRATSIGLVIIPYDQSNILGHEALKGVVKICTNNDLTNINHNMYFDEGIYIPKHYPSYLNIYKNQDSKLVGGIQLADLAAHTFSQMLLEHLGVKRKVLSDFGDSTIGFEMWTNVRHNLFSKSRYGSFESAGYDPMEFSTVNTEDYAVHVADSCSNQLKHAVHERFGTMYLGCIH
jgi:hypothetical protein